jgi:HPt (histidine-containing phosphotransfer) domain-containing protein
MRPWKGEQRGGMEAPATGGGSATRSIDLDSARARLAGDESLLREFIQVYFEEIDPQMAQVREAVQSENATRLRSAAHALKGLASHFGAARMVAAAQQLETAGKAGQLSGVALVFAQLEQERQEVDEQLRAYVHRGR